jgi:hypothetical protein
MFTRFVGYLGISISSLQVFKISDLLIFKNTRLKGSLLIHRNNVCINN